jgi:hypothetical protein
VLGWLEDIWCAIVQLPERIADWLVALVNLFIAGIAGAAQTVIDALPDMPDVPTLPGSVSAGLGWANWFLPVQTLVTQFVAVLGLVVLFSGVAIVLRWVKAL